MSNDDLDASESDVWSDLAAACFDWSITPKNETRSSSTYGKVLNLFSTHRRILPPTFDCDNMTVAYSGESVFLSSDYDDDEEVLHAVEAAKL